MHISFFGAAHEVTGSCHLLDTGKKKILFDCGMFQGGDFNEGKNSDEFPFNPKDVDVVLVSHAHADHTGRIPKLVKDGFSGKIYMTKATAELSEIIWNDAFRIMQYENKKFQAPILFDEQDILHAVKRCIGVDYHTTIDLGDGHSVVFKDAGHIFGAAFIEVDANGKKIGFSGDLGNSNVPILRETDQLGEVDVLLCESTYGDRIHEKDAIRKQILLDIVKEGCEKGGTIMMPAFSIERTQEIIYTLEELHEQGLLPEIPIYIDSPMAIRALPVYSKYPEYLDKEAMQKYVRDKQGFLQFKNLFLTETIEESKRINSTPQPKMIIAGAGMMNGGRILHHAKRYLSDPNSMLVIVGYQAEGTLGRKLYEGAEMVKIHDEDIPVHAKVQAIGALSAHADQQKIISWIRNAQAKPKKIYCVHGEAVAATTLAHRIADELDIPAFVPEAGETVEL